MENVKTHWKKNIDSTYISGEDMKQGLKGLRQEMNVQIVSFGDGKTFDRNKQTELTITSINLVDIDTGNLIYKPIVLNKTNARFLEKEFNSAFIEDWIGKNFVIYAMPDKRHGHVVRCRKYIQQNIDLTPYLKQINECDSSKLQSLWDSLPQNIRNYKAILDAFNSKK